MNSSRKYRKQGSLQEYSELVRDRVHNCLKHGDTNNLKKYQVYLKASIERVEFSAYQEVPIVKRRRCQ